MARQNISSGGPFEEIAGYSRAVRVGDQIFVAGTTAINPDGRVDSYDVYDQARLVLGRIVAAVRDAGGDAGDIVRTRMFVTDIKYAKAVMRAHGEIFAAIRPAATLVAVDRLVDPILKVEIEADAVVGAGTPA